MAVLLSASSLLSYYTVSVFPELLLSLEQGSWGPEPASLREIPRLLWMVAKIEKTRVGLKAARGF
jgi:hypothetical protein